MQKGDPPGRLFCIPTITLSSCFYIQLILYPADLYPSVLHSSSSVITISVFQSFRIPALYYFSHFVIRLFCIPTILNTVYYKFLHFSFPTIKHSSCCSFLQFCIPTI